MPPLLILTFPPRPHYSVLGKVADTDIYRDTIEYSEVRGASGQKEHPKRRAEAGGPFPPGMDLKIWGF